jgi:hypothetical protein
MTPSDSHEAGVAGLGGLLRLAPDPDRAGRVRLRCRARLARSRRPAALGAAIAERTFRSLAPVVVGGVCVLYVVALVATTLRLEGFLP